MAQTMLTIRIQDWPEVKAFLEDCARRVETLEAVLRGIEWSQPEDTCPWCHWMQRQGHAIDCGIGKALSKK